MNEFNYVPDQEIEIHREQAIRLLIRNFSSHQDGLPEWIKNASDQYAREDAPEERRVIVIFFDSGRRNMRSSIACLDFCGMTSAVIEQNFKVWFDPDAAHRGATSSAKPREGGHGNGGKAYMCNLFEDYAVLHTVRDGQGCRYGVKGGTIKFGYVPNPAEGRNFLVTKIEDELGKLLADVRCSIDRLPAASKHALSIASGFTFVKGVGPKYCDDSIPYRELIRSLESHLHMIQALQFCRVFPVVNGLAYEQGRQMTVPTVIPMEGAELPREIPIPESLTDPETAKPISTTVGGTKSLGSLVLRTSNKDMRYSNNKYQHIVSFRAETGWIGYVGVTELDVLSPYRNKIYGECFLPALEQFKQNDRARLARSPLTCAVEKFVAEQIETYAREFEARDRRAVSTKEKSELSKMNQALDRWKNRFIEKTLRGIWVSGEGISPPVPLPTGTPIRIEISNAHRYAGLGVSFRPRLRFFDADNRQVRAVPYSWYSQNTNVALVDESLNVVRTFTHGHTELWVEALGGKLKSLQLPLDVIRIRSIGVLPNEVEIPRGSRLQLKATCRLSSGQETDDVYLVWFGNDDNVVTVSSGGMIYAHGLGSTEVTAGDDACVDTSPARIAVIESPPRESGRSQYPQILLSEVDPDPDTGEPRVFPSSDPPVCQGPLDVERDIWWINRAAPLARLYLNSDLGYGHNSEAWRMYHIERIVEIMAQIRLFKGPTETEERTVRDWIPEWGGILAEFQSAVVSDLKDFISKGLLPEG